MMQAQFHQGTPLMLDYTPSGAVSAGDVIVINGRPYVAHTDIAAGQLGAVAAGGGVYTCTAAANLAPGAKVYWNDSTNKITTATGSHPHFGWIVPSSDPAADGDPVIVQHAPDGTATAAS